MTDSDEHYRLLFEKNPMPMWVYDTSDLSFIAVNDAAIAHYGYSREEFLSMTLRDIRPAADLEALAQGLSHARLEPLTSGIYHHLKRSGEMIEVEVSSHELELQGRPARLVLANDVTARNRAEREIRRLNEELEGRVELRTHQLMESNKELEAFCYSVSHDLRAPLRAMDGFSQILVEDYADSLPSDARRCIDTIRQNARHMGMLIDDLLSFSRLGRQPLQKRAVDLNELVHDVLLGLEPDMTGRQIQISIGELTPCEGDPALLRQAFANLLSNAIKYSRTRNPALIEIGIVSNESSGGTARTGAYFVKDNGVGFDMHYAHKLFGVFQRLHRSEEYEGTGVGLAIVHRIVTRHGGRIWAYSDPPRETVFYFTLAGEEQSDREPG